MQLAYGYRLIATFGKEGEHDVAARIKIVNGAFGHTLYTQILGMFFVQAGIVSCIVGNLDYCFAKRDCDVAYGVAACCSLRNNVVVSLVADAGVVLVEFFDASSVMYDFAIGVVYFVKFIFFHNCKYLMVDK